jgi:hypothetical protein
MQYLQLNGNIENFTLKKWLVSQPVFIFGTVRERRAAAGQKKEDSR